MSKPRRATTADTIAARCGRTRMTPPLQGGYCCVDRPDFGRLFLVRNLARSAVHHVAGLVHVDLREEAGEVDAHQSRNCAHVRGYAEAYAARKTMHVRG